MGYIKYIHKWLYILVFIISLSYQLNFHCEQAGWDLSPQSNSFQGYSTSQDQTNPRAIHIPQTVSWDDAAVCRYGLLTRFAKLPVRYAPGMPGTFSPPPRFSDPVSHVPRCMPGSLTSDFLWCRWLWKRSRYSWRICNQHFCVSGKRPM